MRKKFLLMMLIMVMLCFVACSEKPNFNIYNIETYLSEYENFLNLLKKRNDEYVIKTINDEKNYFDSILEKC